MSRFIRSLTSPGLVLPATATFTCVAGSTCIASPCIIQCYTKGNGCEAKAPTGRGWVPILVCCDFDIASSSAVCIQADFYNYDEIDLYFKVQKSTTCTIVCDGLGFDSLFTSNFPCNTNSYQKFARNTTTGTFCESDMGLIQYDCGCFYVTGYRFYKTSTCSIGGNFTCKPMVGFYGTHSSNYYTNCMSVAFPVGFVDPWNSSQAQDGYYWCNFDKFRVLTSAAVMIGGCNVVAIYGKMFKEH